jgi:hypothetical protein
LKGDIGIMFSISNNRGSVKTSPPTIVPLRKEWLSLHARHIRTAYYPPKRSVLLLNNTAQAFEHSSTLVQLGKGRGATRPCLHALVVVLAAPEQCPCCVHGRKTSGSPSTFATRPSKAKSKTFARSSETGGKAGAQRIGLATTMRKFCLALLECVCCVRAMFPPKWDANATKNSAVLLVNICTG